MLNKGNATLKIAANANRDICSWLGGSVVASLPAFEEQIVTMCDSARP